MAKKSTKKSEKKETKKAVVKDEFLTLASIGQFVSGKYTVHVDVASRNGGPPQVSVYRSHPNGFRTGKVGMLDADGAGSLASLLTCAAAALRQGPAAATKAA